MKTFAGTVFGIYILSMTLFVHGAYGADYPIATRNIVSASCVTGTYKADPSFMPGGFIKASDFSPMMRAFRASVIEEGAEGVAVFRDNGNLCVGAPKGGTLIIIAYRIL